MPFIPTTTSQSSVEYATFNLTNHFNSQATLVTLAKPTTHATATPPSNSATTYAGRKVTFINNCNDPIALKITPGSVNPNPGVSSCKQDSDCSLHSGTCDTINGVCYSALPTFSPFLAASGGSTEAIFLGDPSQQDGVVFSGNVIACATGGDTNSTAPGSSMLCDSSSFPATRAEFTLARSSPDYYDISMIDGVNLPVAMRPISSTSSIKTWKTRMDNPYWCGAPGSYNSSTSGLGSCSWKFTPPSPHFVAVAPPASTFNNSTFAASSNSSSTCTSDKDCSSEHGLVCGSILPPSYPPPPLTCGKFVAYHPPRSQCKLTNTCDSPIISGTPPPPNNKTLFTRSSTTTTTWMDMFGCTPPLASCYQPDSLLPSSQPCCGCMDWATQGIQVPGSPLTKQCLTKNSVWMEGVLPYTQWMKEACPSAYSYPYDDASSTFLCAPEAKDTLNLVEYEISWCPK